MTYREAFEDCLIELNKVQAPALLLDDFVYLFNKAIQKYINKRYNVFEVSQQLTDDLRVLLRTKKIDVTSSSLDPNVFKDSYTCQLPDDYMHILNCICEFKHTKAGKCDNTCTTFQVGANKLDTSEWPHIINNYYMKPSAKRPYYYISNIENPEPWTEEEGASGSPARKYKQKEKRYGNSTKPIMQIKCGNDRQSYQLKCVYIDYLRAPQFVSVDQIDLDKVEDTTPQIEFPDYVTLEIINELVTLILENGKDPRMQTQYQVGQSIPQGQTSQTTR